jgi:hypothetical protein
MSDSELFTVVLRGRGEGRSAELPGTSALTQWRGVEGVVEGQALNGTLHGSLRTHDRGDGVKEVVLHSLVRTASGAVVSLAATGRASSAGDALLLPVLDAQAAELAHLNAALCVARGRLDPDGSANLTVTAAAGS